LSYYSGHKIVYIFDFIYWSKNKENVGVRPARHPAGGFIEPASGLDESSPYV
jgi:hypothetical protein